MRPDVAEGLASTASSASASATIRSTRSAAPVMVPTRSTPVPAYSAMASKSPSVERSGESVLNR